MTSPFSGKSEPEKAQSDIDYKALTVLVVDDIFNVRAMLKSMLRQIGFASILEAANAPNAIELLRREVVDLVLCDWNMPGLKGVDVLRHVRKRPESHDLPFVMVTGEISEGIVAEAAETEVDAYLVKPFNLQQLADKINLVLSSHTEVSEIDSHLSQGRAFVITRQFSDASKAFKAALAINPRSPRTLLEIGRLYEEQGNDVRAREYYHRAIKVQPRFLKAHMALTNIYQAIGEKEKYLEHLKTAVKISPRNLERRFMLSQAYLEAGDKDQAKGILSEILQDATKQYSEIVDKVGAALLALGAYDLAETAFEKAINADPKNLHLFNQLGIAYRHQRKFDQAVSNYLRALKLSPKDENLLFNLGLAYADSGNKPKAVKAVKQALRLNPDFKEAKKLLAKLS